MKHLEFLLIIITSFCACTERPMSNSMNLQVHEARFLADFDGEVFSEWDTVQVQTENNKVATYVVSSSPLLTAWNFLALNASQQHTDNTQIVTVRLNAFAEKKMRNFSQISGNLKVPLGLRAGDRWINFSPLLNPVTDRMTLRGLNKSEVAALQDYIKNR